MPIHHASRIAETSDLYVQESGMTLHSGPSLHEREKCRLTHDLVFMKPKTMVSIFHKESAARKVPIEKMATRDASFQMLLPRVPP